MVTAAEGAIKDRLADTARGTPNGMAAAQDHTGCGFFHAGDQLGNAQPRLYVPAHGVQQHQQPLHLFRFLYRRQQRHDVLVFRGLGLRREGHVPLHLPDNGQAVGCVPGWSCPAP